MASGGKILIRFTSKTARWLLMSSFLVGAAHAELPSLSYNPSHGEMMKFVVAAAKQSPSLSVASIGQSVRGRTIPVVIAHDPSVSPTQMTRILILCRQHGNEPAGTVAMLDLIRNIAEGDARLQAQLRRVCLLIVPMVNPDGADANTRHNARDADLNRDWINRYQPESQAVEYLFNLWDPEVVLDLHELHWRDSHGLNTIEAPEPGVVIEAIGEQARSLQAAILSRLRQAGFPSRVSSWAGGNNMHLCHRHFSRDHGKVSLLFESERQNMRTPLPRRSQMHEIGVRTVIDYYYGKTPQLPRLALAPPALQSPSLPNTATDAGSGPGVNGGAYLGPALPQEASIEVSAPDLSEPIPSVVRLRINVSGIDDLKYVAVRIDGEPRFLANHGPFSHNFRLEPGRHAILVQAHRDDGSVVEREYLVTVRDG